MKQRYERFGRMRVFYIEYTLREALAKNWLRYLLALVFGLLMATMEMLAFYGLYRLFVG